MSTPQNPDPTAPHAASAAENTALQSDAETAPESAWFFAWFKSAMLYLAAVTTYLGTVTALVAAWKTVNAEAGKQADFTTYALAGLLALPLFLAFFCNLLPALRRRRERTLRPITAQDQPPDATWFQTSPRDTDPHGFFAHGYEPFLTWTSAPRAPLLHLTGLSGSGKSSLLAACLTPALAKSGITVLTVRSYGDPLDALKAALLTLWENPPKDYAALAPLAALQRAVTRLGKENRLLIAFDQFEEYFLLRAAAPQPGTPPTEQPAVTLPEEKIAPLRDFLHAFLADPPDRLTLLLSYREDHRILLAPLALSPRTERTNWMIVEPFDFAAATHFLRSCPGLTIPPRRMDLVLREAAQQEGGRVLMRPIVANLLGLVLRRMAGHPTLWRRRTGLLRAYVRDTLGRETLPERSRLLREMLTDFQTARPRTAEHLARAAKLPPALATAHLENLQRTGIVRPVAAHPSDPTQTLWQIAHDFLATLTERVLDATHRTLWRTLRPWLAPTAAILAASTLIVYPWVQELRTTAQLANAGFYFNQETATIEQIASTALELKSLDDLSLALSRLNPRRLDLGGCSNLVVVERLPEGLEELNLNNCARLETVIDLPASLRTLKLTGCKRLTALDKLPADLKELDLERCGDMTRLAPLPASLTNLGIRNCTKLTHLNAEATSFQLIDVTGCESLQAVDHMPQGVEVIYLNGCTGLSSLKNLRGGVKELHLNGCVKLRSLEGLRKGVERLNLAHCTGLSSLEGLPEGVKTLDLNECTELSSLEHLTRDVKELDLKGCTGLSSLEHLPEGVETLVLDGCTKLSSLKHLTKDVKRLDLTGCTELSSLEHLTTGVETLDLKGCTKLSSLKHMTSDVKRLDLTGCDRLIMLDYLPEKLEVLHADRCSEITMVVRLPKPLEVLNVEVCVKLESIGELSDKLNYVNIASCPALDAETRGRLREWAEAGKEGERTLKE